MRNHQEYYDNWAKDYDKDVATREYVDPEYLVNYFLEMSKSGKISLPCDIPDLKVIDVGCGTGFVGVELKKAGFRYIDGVDNSQGMVEQAHKTGAYQTLIGRCDLHKEAPFIMYNQYDLAISCGVFTLDLVKPSALDWLVKVTKPEGIILLTSRVTYTKEHQFDRYCKDLERQGKLSLVEVRSNLDYLGISKGDYWLFSKPKSKK